jgi:diamine N-acetyltransferase
VTSAATPLIRPGEPGDADRLAVLACQVWLHTYAWSGINAEIAAYVLSELTPGKYAALLREPQTRVLVAESSDSLVGFAVVKSGEACPADPGLTVELKTLYVQEHFIGQGIGRDLLLAAQAVVREQSGSVPWLTVNAQNARAIAFYDRQGYSKIGTTWFVLGEGRHENHVLVGPDA